MYKFLFIIIFFCPLWINAQNELNLNSNEILKIKEIITQGENIYKEYFMTSHLEYRNEKGKIEKSSLIGAIKINSSLSLFIQTAPRINKGKIFLQRGNETFMYFPKAKRYMLISSSSKLIGNVSYADIMKMPTLTYYKIEKAYRQKNKNRNIIEVHFVLKENAVDVPYFKKVIFINMNEKRLERIDNYSRSGLLLASCENLAFEKFDEANVPVKMKITDRSKPNTYSVISNTDIKKTSLEQKIFNPGFLQYAMNYILRKYKR